MKTIVIGTKAQADKIIVESLFKPVNGHTLRAMRYDMGKYKAKPDMPYVGSMLNVADDIYAMYVARGKDSDGPYCKMMCVTV